jgi:DnaJ-class molecular chaperone
MPTSSRDHYEVLGVPRDASASEIQQAFRARARQIHPDVSAQGDAVTRFHELSAAYDVLRDPARRARYDRRTGDSDPRLVDGVIGLGPIVIRVSGVFRWLS